MASDNRTAHESTLEQPNELMDTGPPHKLRYRACMSLFVSLYGTLRFIGKRIGLARFAGVNPR